jgi:hypothetical protein
MRSWKLAWLAASAVALLAPAALAAEPQGATAPETTTAATADTTASAPGATAASSGAAGSETAASSGRAASGSAAQSAAAAPLGPVGRDEQGRIGRIHVVRKGDTLWGISDAYLGTPWVWPSIWQDNDGIENPHRILPGDRIWITPSEMRRVSQEEADALVAAGDALAPGLPADLDLDGMPAQGEPLPTYRFAEVETTGFVSEGDLAGAATIVDSPLQRTWLGDHDTVVIGLGADAVAPGDQFLVFRTREPVSDPATGEEVGYRTQELGWLEVTEAHPESATAIVRVSRSEMRRGDHLLPRRARDPEIAVREAPDVEGRVLYTPGDRLEMGTHDVVYLDRGRSDGLEIGSPLEVYRPLGSGVDEVTGPVRLPDEVVAKLLVVDTRESTAVAVVTHTTAEVSRGDRFRGAASLSPAE